MSDFQAPAGGGSALTGAEIKAAYESQPDTNAFNDAEEAKLGRLIKASDDLTPVDSAASAEGDVFLTKKEGYSYSAAPAAATDHHLTTPGGKKLYANPKQRTFHIEQVGGAADNTTQNAALANTLLDYMAANGGGELVFAAPGSYLLEDTGANVDGQNSRQCLHIGGSDIQISIPNAATTLKLADGQQTDAGGAVDLITFSTALSNISIVGRGKISGNTAGQPGWTGGYQQLGAGCIIAARGAGGGSGFLFEGIGLEDHFSNPIYLSAQTGTASDVKVRDISCKNVGEGANIARVSGLSIDGYKLVIDNGMAMAGDALEPAECTDFDIRNVDLRIVSGTPAGAAIDLVGSQRGIVTDFFIDGFGTAFGMDGGFPSLPCDDITVSQGVIRNMGAGTQLAEALGRVIYRDIDLENCGIVAQLGYTAAQLLAAEAFEMHNIRVFGGTGGAVIHKGERTLRWHGGGIWGRNDNGIVATTDADNATRDFDVKDVHLDCGQNDLRFNNNSRSGFAVTGGIDGVSFGSTPTVSDTDVDYSGLNVSHVEKEQTVSTGNTASVSMTTNLYWNTNQLRTLTGAIARQRVDIVFLQSCTVDHDNVPSGSDSILLSGGVNFAAGAGDTLRLEYRVSGGDAPNGAGWYETQRGTL